MKNTNLLLMMFFVVLAFTACKKDVNDPNSNQPGSMNDLVISDDFNWETFKDIDVTISITGAKDYQAKSKVSVFNADPASGGKLMVSGNAAPVAKEEVKDIRKAKLQKDAPVKEVVAEDAKH